MSNLIGSLETPKKAFQTYTVNHGIERVEVQVPIDRAPAFESQFAKLTDKSVKNIVALVESVGGKMRK